MQKLPKSKYPQLVAVKTLLQEYGIKLTIYTTPHKNGNLRIKLYNVAPTQLQRVANDTTLLCALQEYCGALNARITVRNTPYHSTLAQAQDVIMLFVSKDNKHT